MVQLPTCEGDIRISQNLMKTLKIISLERIIQYCQIFHCLVSKKYSALNESISFSEYSVLLRNLNCMVLRAISVCDRVMKM